MKKRIGSLMLGVLAVAFVLGSQAAHAASPAGLGASSAQISMSGRHHRLAFDWWSDWWSQYGNNGDNNGGGTTSVPEPATMSLLALGLGGVIVARKKKKT